jgi:hypothetical protein
MADSDA